MKRFFSVVLLGVLLSAVQAWAHPFEHYANRDDVTYEVVPHDSIKSMIRSLSGLLADAELFSEVDYLVFVISEKPSAGLLLQSDMKELTEKSGFSEMYNAEIAGMQLVGATRSRSGKVELAVMVVDGYSTTVAYMTGNFGADGSGSSVLNI